MLLSLRCDEHRFREKLPNNRQTHLLSEDIRLKRSLFLGLGVVGFWISPPVLH